MGVETGGAGGADMGAEQNPRRGDVNSRRLFLSNQSNGMVRLCPVVNVVLTGGVLLQVVF